MAFFKPTEGSGTVPCYEGTTASKTKPAELKNDFFIEKARKNPDFTEVKKTASKK